MSSESEIEEEFYDAEDETTSTAFVNQKRQQPPSSLSSDLEREERYLLDLKRRAEERRRREDEELERRLAELYRKKEAEEIHKEVRHQLFEQEQRRRKLEEMRQLLGSDSSLAHLSSQDSSSLEKDSPGFSTSAASEAPDVFSVTGSAFGQKSHTIERMENSSAPTQTRQHAKKRSGSWGDLPNNDSRPLERVSVERNDSVESETATALPQDLALNLTRFQPEKDQQHKRLTMLMNERKMENFDLSTQSVVDDIIKETETAGEEPDIVKSTKTRTPPDTLLIQSKPVAPPRKRKKTNLTPTASSSAEDQGDLTQEELSSFPIPLPSPMFPRSSKGMEAMLDLSSVVEGSRLINTEEAEAGVAKTVSPLDPAEDVFTENCGAKEESVAGRCQVVLREEAEKSNQPLSTRPRSNSGRPLTDQEILEMVTVRNLDTGEMMPLSVAEDRLPQCVNPLSLHIMRRTKEYSSDSNLRDLDLSDESDSRSEKSVASSGTTQRRKGTKFKKLLGKTVNKMKSVADHVLHGDEQAVEEEVSVDGKIFKIKSSNTNKGPYDFSQPNLLQELTGEHTGAIWTMKFSPCGKLLATGGQDSILRVWVLKSCYSYFDDIRRKYEDVRITPAQDSSQESLSNSAGETAPSTSDAKAVDPLKELVQEQEEENIAPFMRKPFCTYKGHSADLLDISWSKNYFILSSSMDKTVRLWHISRRECLCTFQHIDFVTAIVFHPKDDRYFLSGSLDGKLRLWNIPDKKVTMWNELSGTSNLITTANFCHNGRLAVVGTYDGRCIFYTTDQLKYYTMLHVRSTRGKNARGRKITGIESMPGEEKILVTSNDSRVRLYSLKDLTLTCKYKGGTNNSSQIKASFSSTGKYIICGSEDHFLYIWKTNHEFVKFSSARRDRNDYWEAIKVHNAVVTAAVFAANPSFIFRMAMAENATAVFDDDTEEREIIVSADFTGAIKVTTNRPKS
ncbi:WD repeat-containing protein 44-like [Pomacea canaliculata]|uniref:WD repeat-containing protein 44-like n=1 Tax=Pomacea canaliculata TaxID=400727 RepID=UPI000D72BC96|nr:WD repeat-containing protein 44-like [Pomacea canaliculata]